MNLGRVVCVLFCASALVILIGWVPIGIYGPLAAPPYEFSVKIPRNIAAGKYQTTADRCTAPEHCVSSKPVDLVVDRSD